MAFHTPLRRYVRTVVPLLMVIGAMTGLVSYSPTLYRLFCNATGLSGTTKRADLSATAKNAVPETAVADDREITVKFDTNVGNGLDWDFRPAQGQVKVKLGVPTQVFFTAHNRSDKTIIGRAVYNVTPYQVGAYFYKIQCFCFTNEKLGPGETAQMPVLFFIDKSFAKDPDTRLFSDITLSYTFYPKKDLTPDAVSQARDLAAGSQIESTSIRRNDEQTFNNDAPRR